MPHPYADFIAHVEKPARYLGGEYMSISKPLEAVQGRMCLAFPDVYDIGMSHLGTKILYALINSHADLAAERCFAPWIDLEAELRRHGVPLVSLETHTPLSEFDVLGISLQYELTFTNVLNMLELGGIAVRTSARAPDAPLVLVGGPVATHPEPLAPFIDAAFIGEAEATLPALLREWAQFRRQIRSGGISRREALCQLASRYALYVPELYSTTTDAATGATVIDAPLDLRAPRRIARATVPNLDDYPFPSSFPVPYAEAVFERASVEIARGCTEGCRFCQAGTIYRPVRERSPQSIADSLLAGVDKAGYDETGLTCLSTADFSSITPLVSKLAGELKQRGVSMSVASLRAYGLSEQLLDVLATTRIAGLTFAPEAGTQRMRDVVNKNVTEAHIEESTRRVFDRGWHRLKLYFMIGLPTEETDDVLGIVETGKRMLDLGRARVGNRAEVTVSVSSHVPKPHTPFQWAAQDSSEDIAEKQLLLRRHIVDRGLRIKLHHRGISFVEGVLARGDRRVADIIETAWRAGARFDGWDELFDIDIWRHAMTAHEFDWETVFAARPVHARLPWDHIDVGLEDGFLLSEYQKALKGRASPPCGKVAGELVHHTNLHDALADKRKLVCYDCGIACDLGKIRSDRLAQLVTLNAKHAVVRSPQGAAEERKHVETERKQRVLNAGKVGSDAPFASYRVSFAKVGRAGFLSHLDMVRLWSRMLRRAGLPIAMSRGFSPKPRLAFSPALGLGIPSLHEVVDMDLEYLPFVGKYETEREQEHLWLAPHHAGVSKYAVPVEVVRQRLEAAVPEGIVVVSVEEITGRPAIGRLVTAIDLVVQPAADGMRLDAARAARLGDALIAQPRLLVLRKDRPLDIRPFVLAAHAVEGEAAAQVCQSLDWPATEALICVRVSSSAEGSVKPSEVLAALRGDLMRPSEDLIEVPRVGLGRVARLALVLTPTAPARPMADGPRADPAALL